MANEIQTAYLPAQTVYALVRNAAGAVWNGSAFVTYVTANLSTYAINLTQQGGSGYYTGDFPSTAPAGSYNVVAYIRGGGSPAEGDTLIATGIVNWQGLTTEYTDVRAIKLDKLDQLDDILGDGAWPVDQDSGGTDDLTYQTSVGAGIDGATILCYLKSDYDADNRTAGFIVARTTTTVNGYWFHPIMLDQATYTLIYYKQGAYGPDRKNITVSSDGTVIPLMSVPYQAPEQFVQWPAPDGEEEPEPLPVQLTPSLPPEEVAAGLVDHDFGGQDNLTYTDTTGAGIVGASIIIFRKSDYDGKKRQRSNAVAYSFTGTGGRWARAVVLPPGEYVAVFSKPAVAGPDIAAFQVG